MLIFHKLYTLFQSFSRTGEIIIFCILIAVLVLNMKTLHSTTAFSPLKAMTWFHVGYQFFIPLLINQFVIPGWLIWFEILFFAMSIILIFKELGFLKGLCGIPMYWLSFFAINIVVEMYFIDGLLGWAIVISIALYLLIFKVLKVKA